MSAFLNAYAGPIAVVLVFFIALALYAWILGSHDSDDDGGWGGAF